MRILITGSNGQLGRSFQKILKKDVLFVDREEMDIIDFKAVKKIVDSFKPEVIIHCAAFTNVDACENDSETCFKVNVGGTFNIAIASKEIGATLVYVSTDYVFDGKKDGFYDEQDSPNPVSVYGQTKYLGEIASALNPKHYIVRTSWVFGDGKNFIKTMLQLSLKKKNIKVVSDQIGRITYSEELAKGIIKLLGKNPKSGIYNLTGSGKSCSWADLAKEIFDIKKKKVKITSITTKQYIKTSQSKKIAPRPKNSKLDLCKIKKIGFNPVDWKKSLEEYLEIKR